MSLVKSLASTADGKPIERMNRSTRRDTSPRDLIAQVAAICFATPTATAAPAATAAVIASPRRTARFFEDAFFVLDFFAGFFVVDFFDFFALLFFALLFFEEDFFRKDFPVDFFVAISTFLSHTERQKMKSPYPSKRKALRRCNRFRAFANRFRREERRFDGAGRPAFGVVNRPRLF
jgi:hypothetical protein